MHESDKELVENGENKLTQLNRIKWERFENIIIWDGNSTK